MDYSITAQPTGATRYDLVERMEGTQRVLDVVIIAGGETNINFEALNGQHPITVEGYNGSTRVDAGSFTFNLNNINERPTSVWLNSAGNTEITVQENQPLNVSLATLGVVDPDGLNLGWGRPSVTYQVDSSDRENYPHSGLYTIINGGSQTSPSWRLAASGVLDYEALPEGAKFHIVKVIATDGGGLTFTQLLRVNITNDPNEGPANQAPSSPAVVTGTLRELTEAVGGAMNVATVESTDDGAGGTTLGYELRSTFNSLFSVTNAGVIIFNGTAQEYENNNNLMVEDAGTAQERKYFNVEVRAKESGTGGLTSGYTTVKVYVNDVNEAVSDATYAPNVMSESAQVGTVVAAAPTVVDPDTAFGNRNFNYTLVGSERECHRNGPSNFAVDIITGVITVGDKAKQADDYFVYDAKKRVLYYDADGSGSKAAIEMATFTNNKALKGFGYKEFFFI